MPGDALHHVHWPALLPSKDHLKHRLQKVGRIHWGPLRRLVRLVVLERLRHLWHLVRVVLPEQGGVHAKPTGQEPELGPHLDRPRAVRALDRLHKHVHLVRQSRAEVSEDSSHRRVVGEDVVHDVGDGVVKDGVDLQPVLLHEVDHVVPDANASSEVLHCDVDLPYLLEHLAEHLVDVHVQLGGILDLLERRVRYPLDAHQGLLPDLQGLQGHVLKLVPNVLEGVANELKRVVRLVEGLPNVTLHRLEKVLLPLLETKLGHDLVPEGLQAAQVQV